LAWGSDALSYRAADLDKIRKWTAKEPDWKSLLHYHHQVRPKPSGKPTWHVVTQMTGEHGYQRSDARKAFLAGLEGVVPASWRMVDEHAAIEFWLTIHGATAIAGVRLSDATMRHRTYKLEHRAASLRPVVAAAMARLAGAGPNAVVVDPTCGAGTILAEQLTLARDRGFRVQTIGGDLEWGAVYAAGINLRRLGAAPFVRWDARRLPLAAASVDRIVANPPFGIQLGDPAEVRRLYQQFIPECDRVLRPGGKAVLLMAEPEWLRPAAQKVEWTSQREVRIRLLGQPATIGVWRKPA
jgi:23S rRNA G2445 N2-methylase RlmL